MQKYKKIFFKKNFWKGSPISSCGHQGDSRPALHSIQEAKRGAEGAGGKGGHNIKRDRSAAGQISREEAKSRHRSTGRERRTQEGRSRQEEQQARPPLLLYLYMGKNWQPFKISIYKRYL